MAGLDSADDVAATTDRPTSSETDSDTHPTTVMDGSSTDQEEDDHPGSLILRCDHIINAVIQYCTKAALARLAGVNREFYDLVTPMLYSTVRLNDAAIPAFFYGATLPRSSSSSSPKSRKSKVQLLATTRILTLETHDAKLCSENVPGAACMTGLQVLRLAMDMDDPGHTVQLCSHSQCEFLQVLQPHKLVVRNCNGRTILPLDLRWSLPPCVKTAVIVLPVSAQEYYDPEGDPFPPLTRSLAGQFRLVSRMKIVFWDGFEGSNPRRDFLTSYRRRRILVDDLVPLIQNAVCTNHRPWPLISIYGLEMLDLKAGSSSALARIHGGFADSHDLVHYAIETCRSVLVSSPWTGHKLPYRVPKIVWEDIETYEQDDEERLGEIDDDDE